VVEVKSYAEKQGRWAGLIRRIGGPHTGLIGVPQAPPHTQMNNNDAQAIALKKNFLLSSFWL
jgi:hypothetical protein